MLLYVVNLTRRLVGVGGGGGGVKSISRCDCE
jgi:hypothetical protein